MQIVRRARHLAVLATLVASAASAAPAHAAYQPIGYDVLRGATARAGVFSFTRGVPAHVQWTKDGTVAPTFRAEIKHTWVADFARTPNLCVYARVEFGRMGTTISWPPSTAPTSTTDGYARSCRRPGQLHPTPLNLHGINLASKWLNSVTVTTCHQISATSAKVCSAQKAWRY